MTAVDLRGLNPFVSGICNLSAPRGLQITLLAPSLRGGELDYCRMVLAGID